MKKDKQLEKIQLEYDLYDGGEVLSVNKAVGMIFDYLEEVDVTRSYIDLEKKRNNRKRLISRVLGKHAQKFGYLGSWYYDMDDLYLDKKLEILDIYYGQLNSFFGAVNNENFSELFKLITFTRYKNRGYRADIEEQRECVRKSSVGEGFVKPIVLDESTIYMEWFSDTLNKISCIKNVAKAKK